ncbi:hypothetical protein [Streptomyces sp. NPDC101455]
MSATGTGRPPTLWEVENVADVYSPLAALPAGARRPPVRRRERRPTA